MKNMSVRHTDTTDLHVRLFLLTSPYEWATQLERDTTATDNDFLGFRLVLSSNQGPCIVLLFWEKSLYTKLEVIDNAERTSRSNQGRG